MMEAKLDFFLIFAGGPRLPPYFQSGLFSQAAAAAVAASAGQFGGHGQPHTGRKQIEQYNSRCYSQLRNVTTDCFVPHA